MIDPSAAKVSEEEWEEATASCVPLRVAKVIEETHDSASLVLEIPPELEARFRYRVKDGRLTMSYELIRAHKAHEAAVKATYEEIKDGMNAGTLLRGSHA